MKLWQVATIVLAGMLTACTPAQQDVAMQGSVLASNLVVADRLLQSGEVERSVLSVKMTDVELDTLVSAFDEYSHSRDVISQIIEDPAMALDVEQIIYTEHVRLSEAYRAVQSVVLARWDTYSAVDQARLKRWRAQVERLEVAYQNFVAAVDAARSESAKAERIIEMARIVGQIALLAV